MNNNLEKFNYNVIIANMHETYNFLTRILGKEFNKDIFIKNFRKNSLSYVSCNTSYHK